MHERVVHADVAERYQLAWELLPPVIADRLVQVPLFEGNVEFAGVCPPLGEFTYQQHSRLRTMRKRDSAMCHWPGPGDRQGSWISFPGVGYRGHYMTGITLHELGHAVWNVVVRPFQRTRTYPLWGGHVVRVHPRSSGLVPPSRTFTSYQPDNMVEQFAEAFRIWLSPAWLLEAAWEPGRFYVPESPDVNEWGVRWQNRSLLAFLNELAGWPWDRPPRALCDA